MEHLAGTRALPALQTSGKVSRCNTRSACAQLLVFQSSGFMVDTSTRNGCIFSVLPLQPLLVPPLISTILYWQTAIQFDQLMSTRVA